MSLANEDWATNNIGEESIYTMMQQWQTLKTLYGQNPDMVPKMFVSCAQAKTLQEFAAEWTKATIGLKRCEEQHEDKSAMQWPDLALTWLDKIFR